MISKIKCPFCGDNLRLCEDCIWGLFACCHPTCEKSANMYGTRKLWQALIQAKQDLEQSEKRCSAWETQALDYKAETIALSGELEITTKALEEYANKDNWGCIEDDRDRVWRTYWYFDGCDDGGWVNAEKALEQIKHKEQK